MADFGLTRDIYATDYYRQSHHGRVPVKWMSLESLHDKISNEKTDVVRRTIVDSFTLNTHCQKCSAVHDLICAVQIIAFWE